MITVLSPNQCFVFGSNAFGVHGAGAAKTAFGNHPKYKGSVGDWAIWGTSRGYMQGQIGSSYAIQTKKHWRSKRSVSLVDIESQIIELISFALVNPTIEFLVTEFGCGKAGYTLTEMISLWKDKTVPNNIKLPQSWINGIYTETTESDV